jgi:hypothetical protein
MFYVETNLLQAVPAHSLLFTHSPRGERPGRTTEKETRTLTYAERHDTMQTRTILLLALVTATTLALTSAVPANAASTPTVHALQHDLNPAASPHVPSVVASALARPGTGWFAGIEVGTLALEGMAACLILKFCLGVFRPRRHSRRLRYAT